MKLGRLVHVIWLDAVGDNGWMPVDNMIPGPSACETVGWLIRDEEDFITVAGSRDAQCGNFDGSVTIPKVAVKRIRRLKL